MYGHKVTLYDVLDLPRDSDATAIALAHRRARAELDRETTAPDARRAALVHEAYEVLSDPDRRAAYDRSLNTPNVILLPGGRQVRPRWAGFAAGLAVLAGAMFFTLKQPAPPAGQGAAALSPEEILATAAFSVGLVQGIDLSGRNVAAGLAVAIDEGVMATTCHGLKPNTQLVVRLTGRSAPARIAMADEEHGLCKLAVEGAGSRPLPVSGEAPRAGQAVYAVTFGNDGQVAHPATIKSLIPTPKGNVIEISMAIPASASGGPIVDRMGRLVGIMTASHDFGAGRNVALPAAWLNNPRWLTQR
jgi:S1-C subfamily serine protease